VEGPLETGLNFVVMDDAPKLNWIDTHCHAYAAAFDEDRGAAVQRAFDAGVERILLPNIDAASVGPLLDLVAAHPGRCFPMMGLHPCHVEDDWESECTPILEALNAEPCIAVGEIGMDLFRGKKTRLAQIDAFHRQIGWALERDLPVVLHVREAFEDTFEVLDQYANTPLRGVFHCFTGGQAEVEKIAGYGSFCFGLGGVTTFRKAGMEAVIPHIPEDRIVLETDSPYLAPVPHRGKRNEPSYTTLVGQRVADVLERPVAEVAALSTVNAERLFRLAEFHPSAS
jgi:TatD DNase family protein